MQGYKVQFNIFAKSQEEADKTSRMMAAYVDGMAKRGIAITGEKIQTIIDLYGFNPIVTNYLKR